MDIADVLKPRPFPYAGKPLYQPPARELANVDAPEIARMIPAAEEPIASERLAMFETGEGLPTNSSLQRTPR